MDQHQTYRKQVHGTKHHKDNQLQSLEPPPPPPPPLQNILVEILNMT